MGGRWDAVTQREAMPAVEDKGRGKGGEGTHKRGVKGEKQTSFIRHWGAGEGGPYPRQSPGQLAYLLLVLTLPVANMWPANDFSHRCWPSLPSQGRQLAESQNLRSPERREDLSWPCHRQS